MKIAVEGCCHGELDAIYERIGALERQHAYALDLLLICGDFQAIRNMQDLAAMAVPDKYKQLGGFHKYYTGEKTAPMLTILIGGNHEASNYMWELYHGGWIAPNMYFLGHAGVVQVNGIRIAGASGIFKGHDFHLGHHERMPYDRGTMRSIYHIREYNVRRLSLLSPPDIVLSHDWPAGIEHQGNLRELLARKKFLRADIEKGALGSPPLRGLLQTLRPAWWFAAHLHTRYAARVVHAGAGAGPPGKAGPGAGPKDVVASAAAANPDEIMIDDDELDAPAAAPAPAANPDEIALDMDDNELSAPAVAATPAAASTTAAPADVPAVPSAPRANPDEILLDDEEAEVIAAPAAAIVHAPPPMAARGSETRFLALNKCLPGRDFLEVIDYPAPHEPPPGSPPVFTFDPEWLAVARAFAPSFSRGRGQAPFPPEADARAAVARELEWVRVHVLAGADAKRVEDVQVFEPTAPGGPGGPTRGHPPFYANPQTAAFCAMLEIENRID